jgi:parallel beta-helix repeat protein
MPTDYNQNTSLVNASQQFQIRRHSRTICSIFSCISVPMLLAFVSPIQATDLVVDNRNPHASDQNPGTKQQPLKTISAAAARLQAGDHVTIHGGEYRETVVIKASGTSQAPILFEVGAGETAVIKGSNLVTSWARKSPNVWVAKLPAVPPRSDKQEDASFWQTDDVRQVFIRDGVLTDAVHLRPAESQRLTEGQFFCDSANRQLYIWLSDLQDPNKLTIEASMRTMLLYVLGSNVTVRGLQMRHCNPVGPAIGVACDLLGQNDLLQKCTVSWTGYVGVGLAGKNNTLSACTIACHGNSGVNGSGEGHVIEGCQIIYNNIDRYYFDWHAGGAKLIPGFNHSRIIHNEFAYNIGDGLWLDDGSNDNLLEANVCHDNEGPGIQVEVSARNRVYNNICYGNRNPTMADYLTPEDPNGKRTAQLYRIRRGGEPISNPIYHAGNGRGIYISSSPETKVFHNTCYFNEGEGICVEGPPRKSGSETMSARDCQVLNNISAYNKGTQLVIRRNNSDPSTQGNTSDYNLLVARGAVLAEASWGTYFNSLTDWQQRTGNDEHSIQSDPAFAMGAMGDFRLLSMSPAAHAAPPLDTVKIDCNNRPRPSDRVSMGACELAADDYPRNQR